MTEACSGYASGFADARRQVAQLDGVGAVRAGRQGGRRVGHAAVEVHPDGGRAQVLILSKQPLCDRRRHLRHLDAMCIFLQRAERERAHVGPAPRKACGYQPAVAI